MPRYTFVLKRVREEQCSQTVDAADELAASEAAWAWLKGPGAESWADGQQRCISQSVLLANTTADPESPVDGETPPPAVNPRHFGQLLMSQAVYQWIRSGGEQLEQRNGWISHCLREHLRGNDGQLADPADAASNAAVRVNPGGGGRLLSVWTRPEHPTVWVLTDDYGGPSAVTTALFPEDY